LLIALRGLLLPVFISDDLPIKAQAKIGAIPNHRQRRRSVVRNAVQRIDFTINFSSR
jgi:hypothetical protein